MQIEAATYQKMTFSILLIFFVNWFFQSHFLLQLNDPILKTTGIDNTYWLFCILRIPQFVIKNAFAFDALMITFFFASFIKKNKWSFRFLLLIVIINVITFNVYSGIHSKSCVILPMILLPFCFPKQEDLLKDGVRYYLLFIFISAAFYKIINGGLLYTNQFVHILENQHVDLAILNHGSFTYQLSSWLINHPFTANGLWYLLFASEIVFAIGFFTKKYDKLLAFFLIMLMICTYILMRISLFDFILFLPLLLNNTAVNRHINT